MQAKKLVESINAVGVEYDRDLFERAMRGVHEAFPLQAHAQNPSSSSARSKDDMGSVTGVAGAVTVIHADVQTVDFSDGTAFFIYLVPKGIASLRPALVKVLTFLLLGISFMKFDYHFYLSLYRLLSGVLESSHMVRSIMHNSLISYIV